MFNRNGWIINITQLILQAFKVNSQQKTYAIRTEDDFSGDLNIRTIYTEETG